MIKSATALKANVRNIAKGNSKMAQSYIRIFFMERFLERVSKSSYKEHFILKGGMLVSSMIGKHLRTTMDIDTSIEALPLTVDEIEKLIKLDMIRQPIKIDISTDDVITPNAIEYSYPLMFEKREIELYSYNVETLLAEKTQTILSRGSANTRMRDFYDLYKLTYKMEFSEEVYKEAFINTCAKRKTVYEKEEALRILEEIANDVDTKTRWDQFKKKNAYVGDIDFIEMMDKIKECITHLYE